MRGIACAAVLLTLSSALPCEGQTYRLRVERTPLAFATCSLIHRQDGAAGTSLFFLTAGHLFRSPDGEPLQSPGRVTVLLPGGPVDVLPEDVVLPPAPVVDIAILRATASAVVPAPLPLAIYPPSPGDEFRIAGFDAAERPIDSLQRVRIRTSALLLGDRDASALSACEGAPALSAAGVFGVVVSCERGKVAIVSVLELAATFLRRHVPGLPILERPTPTER